MSASFVVTIGSVDLERRMVFSPRGDVPLSDLETALLAHLHQAEGRPVARDELLREVWGYRSNVRSRAVDHTIKRLRSKLEADRSRPVHLITVVNHGYRLDVRPHTVDPDDGFIGREAELDELLARVRVPGIVTIHGPGGMGKSALGERVRSRSRASHPGGSWWVELEGARSDSAILAATAHTLGMAVAGHTDATERIGRWLGARGRSLLVVDGADHVAHALGKAMERWRRLAPELTVLATTRVRLHCAEEQLVELGPLRPSDATTLLRQRATAVRQDVADDPVVFAELAARLDGMPLAIELAAARSNLLSPRQLLDHLDRRLTLLSGPGRTLQSVLDESWNLASDAERSTLLQLTVFSGGFRVEDAAQVIDTDQHYLDVLQALRDQSWLRAWTPPGTGVLRLGMYDSVQDYLRARPEGCGDAPARHAAVYAAWGTHDALRACRREGGASVQRYTIDYANLCAATEYAIDAGRADWAIGAWSAVHKVVHYRGPFQQSLELAARILDMGIPPSDESRVLRASADLHRRLGDTHEAERWARRAQELAREAGDPGSEALAGVRLGTLLGALGRTEEAIQVLQEADQYLREHGDDVEAASSAKALAAVHQHRGDIEQARGLLERALERAVRAGDLVIPGNVLSALASIAKAQGRIDESITLSEAATEAVDRTEGSTGYIWMNLANLHADLGRHERAIEQYGRALEQAHLQGNVSMRASVQTNLATVHAERNELEQASELLHDALAVHRRSGHRRMVAITLQALGDVAMRSGSPAQAEERLVEARALAEAGALGPVLSGIEVNLAMCLLAQSRVEEASACIDAAVERFRAAGIPHGLAKAACVRGLVAVARGHADEAREALAEAEHLAPEHVSQPTSEIGVLASRLRDALSTEPP